jgi:hypothetical protein
MSERRKQYDISRPTSGTKPRGFKPGKKKTEESSSLGNQIIEANSKDSE